MFVVPFGLLTFLKIQMRVFTPSSVLSSPFLPVSFYPPLTLSLPPPPTSLFPPPPAPSLVFLCHSAVRDSSGRSDVRDAMDAIEAYKNITDAVNAAEKAAKEAKDAADKALKVSPRSSH